MHNLIEISKIIYIRSYNMPEKILSISLVNNAIISNKMYKKRCIDIADLVKEERDVYIMHL